jgi:hypothetical protein
MINLKKNCLTVALVLVGAFALTVPGWAQKNYLDEKIPIESHIGENVVNLGVDPSGVAFNSYSVTYDCAPCYLGFGTDRFDFKLTVPMDVKVEVSDCCVEGDRYEARINNRGVDEDGDTDFNNHEEDTIFGREVTNVPVYVYADLGTITLKPGDWTIRIRDIQFQCGTFNPGCAAGYTVRITFSAPTWVPCTVIESCFDPNNPFGIDPETQPECLDQSIPCIIEVAVDVKPESCPNPLNPKSKGVLPVAVLGSEDFDVNLIDPVSIKLAREGYEGQGVSPLRWTYEDVATPFEGELCECHDLNGDGYMDLTLKFNSQELVADLELDGVIGETIPLILTGNLKDEFGGIAIEGSDCVRIK